MTTETLYDKVNVRHGLTLPPSVVSAMVVKGTPPPGTRIVAALGQPSLPTGVITFRDKTTKATRATLSTTGGSLLTGLSLSNCEMVVSPAELQDLVTVDVYFASGTTDRADWESPVSQGHHWADFGPYPWQRRAEENG